MDESAPVVNLPGDPIPPDPPDSDPQDSLLLAYARLLRIPNVFTAMADIFLGFLFTNLSFQPIGVFLALLASSSLMYLAGMVLNDVYDLEVDAVERPQRPLPSGQIPVGQAHFLGLGMLFTGLALGVGAGLAIGNLRPALVATSLAVLVFSYDRFLKKTPLGPLAMGGCRMLNVLLGMSAAAEPWGPHHLLVAGGLGLYIVGVTWFAKSEAQESNRAVLTLATVVILAGIGVLGLFPIYVPDLRREMTQWYILLAVLAFVVGRRLVVAIGDPSPQTVQVAVKNCLMSLVVLDATAAVVVCQWHQAMLILGLLLPAVVLGRWVYST